MDVFIKFLGCLSSQCLQTWDKVYDQAETTTHLFPALLFHFPYLLMCEKSKYKNVTLLISASLQSIEKTPTYYK